MKRRLGLCFVLAAAAALAAPALPAEAQNTRPREKVPAKPGRKGQDPIKVARWEPHSGAVGTQVTIYGEGFDRKTTLLFGGRRHDAEVYRDKLVFKVPARWGDGSIVLRHPEMGGDLHVGAFEVIADPVIQSWSPASGVWGTRVEVRGTGFRDGDEFWIGKSRMRVDSYGPDRVVVIVPDDAESDYIVVRRGGYEHRGRRPFRVDLAAPEIRGFSPASGGYGAVVRIECSRFDPKWDAVYYGRRKLDVRAHAATWVAVVIPDDARNDDWFYIRGKYGQARSPQKFGLALPPIIQRVSGAYALEGGRIDIYGRNFQPGDRVLLAGQPQKIVQLRPTQITIELVPGARSGRLVVARDRYEAKWDRDFDVVYKPWIERYEPTGGAEGTRVTLYGKHLTGDVEVYYGKQRLRVQDRKGDGAVVVEIPRRARDDRFRVRTRGGEYVTRDPFQVYTYSRVTRIEPKHGPVGTRVTIYGGDFRREDRFWLAGQELEVLEWRRDRVVCTIPKGARSGKITWQSYDRKTDSDLSYTVQVAPVFSGYEPAYGYPGSEITIKGDHFTDRTVVYWGDRKVPVAARRLPRELVIRVPPRSSGRVWLWVEDAGQKVRAPREYEVVAPPQYGGHSPDRGKPGVEISIRGAHFTKDTRVMFGDTECPVVSWKPDVIVVKVPPGYKGNAQDWLWVVDGPHKIRSRSRFRVDPYAEITGFSTNRARPGDQIDVKGRNFSTDTKIRLGNWDCPVVRYSRDGSLVTVRIPADARPGREWMWADEHGNKSRSPAQLEIYQDRPTEKVPARRGDDDKKKRGY